MIRIGRLTDYGIVLMTHVAANPVDHSAAEIATEARLPLPTVSKLLRLLAKEGLLVSHRGVKGGYSLARPAEQISVAGIISAIEGPVALTLCTTVEHNGDCELEGCCPVQGHWQKINRAVRSALEDVTLADIVGPQPRPAAAITPGLPMTALDSRAGELERHR
jgi:FeS assembly SUF system regulator